MIPNQFDYKAPQTLKEAIELLSRGNASIIAGGTSILNAMRSKTKTPVLLVDLKNISEIKGISVENSLGAIKINSMSTFSEIVNSADIAKHCPALIDAIDSINNPQWKNRATIGGSLAFNEPAADVTAVTLVLNANIAVIGKEGKRTIPVDSFFMGPYKTDLNTSEIIVSIDIPLQKINMRCTYLKMKNQANGSAICGIAALIEKTSEGIIYKCRITVTGATACISRLKKTEAALEGKTLTNENIMLAAMQVKNESLDYVTDFAASSEYRAHLTQVLTERAVIKVAGMY